MNGFWTATFRTPIAVGYGVAFFTDTEVFGGDSTFTYLGPYQLDGSSISAKLRIAPFNTTANNVFGGKQSFDLTITGTMQGSTMTGRGEASHYPGIDFEVTLNKVK